MDTNTSIAQKLTPPGARRDRFGLLLVLILLSFFFVGHGDQNWTRSSGGLLIAVVFVIGFRSAGLTASRSGLIAVGAVTIASIGASVAVGLDADGWVTGVAALLLAGVLTSLAVVILRRVLSHRQVSIETIFGAVCVYILVGFVFGLIYAAIGRFYTEPVFRANDGGRVDELYYSIVTLTTLGFGDITSPVELVRRITMIEAIFGQVFLATTVARLVSLFGSNRG